MLYVVTQKNAERPSSQNRQKLSFKPLNIYRYKQGLEGRNRRWQSFFQQNNLPFLEVIYENLVSEFDPIMRQVIEFSGVELPPTGMKITQATQKQGNQIKPHLNQHQSNIMINFVNMYFNYKFSKVI